MNLKENILKAAKATDIPAGKKGLWQISKYTFEKETLIPYPAEGRFRKLEAGTYTQLLRTTGNLTKPSGECVMEDTMYELRKHLDFMLRARGRVLITGLGLGCVTRGTLANPAVTHVTVVEIDPNVLALVQPYMPRDQRLEVIQDDAVRWCIRNKNRFDCTWHDLWTDEHAGQEHLQRVHQKLFFYCREKTGFQGAWNFPRDMRRILREKDGMVLV